MSARRSLASLSAAAIPLFAAATARADGLHPEATLEVTREAGADACPDQPSLRAAIAARLGRDAFAPRHKPREPGARPPTHVAVRFRAVDGILIAHVELREGLGPIRARDVTSTSLDCVELAEATSLALGIAIDPVGPPPPPAPTREPAPRVIFVPAPLQRIERAAPSPPPPKLSLRVAADGLVAFGTAPAPAFGASIEVDARWRSASIGLEGRAQASTSLGAAGGGTVASSLLLASLVPCAHVGLARFCGLASLGALQGRGSGVAHPERDTTAFAALGGRVGVEVPLLHSRFSAGVHGDLAATLTRTALDLDQAAAWITPPVSGSFAIGVSARFP
ncbi:MAG TPA: hypothetical protein VGM56_06155 [Byssovorax sp.]|jgi:hypothetical protein